MFIFFRTNLTNTEGNTLLVDKNFEYQGDFYEEIGDFLKENYLEYGFTKGTKQEVDFLVELMDLPNNSRILDVAVVRGVIL